MCGCRGGFGFPRASSTAHRLHRTVPALRVVALMPTHRTTDLAAWQGFTHTALAGGWGGGIHRICC